MKISNEFVRSFYIVGFANYNIKTKLCVWWEMATHYYQFILQQMRKLNYTFGGLSIEFRWNTKKHNEIMWIE